MGREVKRPFLQEHPQHINVDLSIEMTSQFPQGLTHTQSLGSWLLALFPTSLVPCIGQEPALHISALESTLSLFAEAITKHARTLDNPCSRAERLWGVWERVGTARAEGGLEPLGGQHIPTPKGQQVLTEEEVQMLMVVRQISAFLLAILWRQASAGENSSPGQDQGAG